MADEIEDPEVIEMDAEKLREVNPELHARLNAPPNRSQYRSVKHHWHDVI